MSEYFLWFLVMVVTFANSQSANITCKFTTTGDLCCPDLQEQEEIALDLEARIALLCLINNTQHFDAINDSNVRDGTEVDVTCLVSVLQLDQNEFGRPENKAKSKGPSHSDEIEVGSFQTPEGLKKSSFLVCLVADIRDIFTFRCNDTHSDDKYRYDESDAQRICEKFYENSKYDRYIKSCAYGTEVMKHTCFKIFISVNNGDMPLDEKTRIFPFIPTALKSKGGDGILGIPFRQVGGTPGLIVLLFIYVTGLFLNCIFFIIFIRHEEMRNDSELIIINIVIADVLNLILHSPPIHTYLVNSVHSPLSVTYVFYMIVGLNIYSVMMFSFNIFLTVLPVRNCLNSGYIDTKRYSPHAYALTAAVLACLVPIPLLSCIEEYYTVSLYVLVAYCGVPLCCSALFSLVTPLQLWTCIQSVHCRSYDHEALRGTWSNSANTSAALIVVSMISYIPYFSLPFTLKCIGEDPEVNPFMTLWVFVWSNSCMNPIALYVANSKFRYYFNNYICFNYCGCKK
jgi:hypothetical protein